MATSERSVHTSDRIKAILTSFISEEDESHGAPKLPAEGGSSLALQYNDKEAFLARAQTYTSSTWYGKPPWLSPLHCARYGWENVDVDILQCTSCRAFFSGCVPGTGLLPSVYDECCARLQEQIVAAHRPFCCWVNNPSPEHFLDIPSADRDEELNAFTRRVVDLCGMEGDLPQLDKDDVLNMPITCEQLERVCCEPRFAELPPELLQTAVVLALFGWRPKCESQCAVLQCGFCQREAGVWSFTTFASLADDDKLTLAADILDDALDEVILIGKYPDVQAYRKSLAVDALARVLDNVIAQGRYPDYAKIHRDMVSGILDDVIEDVLVQGCASDVKRECVSLVAEMVDHAVDTSIQRSQIEEHMDTGQRSNLKRRHDLSSEGNKTSSKRVCPDSYVPSSSLFRRSPPRAEVLGSVFGSPTSQIDPCSMYGGFRPSVPSPPPSVPSPPPSVPSPPPSEPVSSISLLPSTQPAVSPNENFVLEMDESTSPPVPPMPKHISPSMDSTSQVRNNISPSKDLSSPMYKSTSLKTSAAAGSAATYRGLFGSTLHQSDSSSSQLPVCLASDDKPLCDRWFDSQSSSSDESIDVDAAVNVDNDMSHMSGDVSHVSDTQDSEHGKLPTVFNPVTNESFNMPIAFTGACNIPAPVSTEYHVPHRAFRSVSQSHDDKSSSSEIPTAYPSIASGDSCEVRGTFDDSKVTEAPASDDPHVESTTLSDPADNVEFQSPGYIHKTFDRLRHSQQANLSLNIPQSSSYRTRTESEQSEGDEMQFATFEKETNTSPIKVQQPSFLHRRPGLEYDSVVLRSPPARRKVCLDSSESEESDDEVEQGGHLDLIPGSADMHRQVSDVSGPEQREEQDVGNETKEHGTEEGKDTVGVTVTMIRNEQGVEKPTYWSSGVVGGHFLEASNSSQVASSGEVEEDLVRPSASAEGQLNATEDIISESLELDIFAEEYGDLSEGSDRSEDSGDPYEGLDESHHLDDSLNRDDVSQDNVEEVVILDSDDEEERVETRHSNDEDSDESTNSESSHSGSDSDHGRNKDNADQDDDDEYNDLLYSVDGPADCTRRQNDSEDGSSDSEADESSGVSEGEEDIVVAEQSDADNQSNADDQSVEGDLWEDQDDLEAEQEEEDDRSASEDESDSGNTSSEDGEEQGLPQKQDGDDSECCIVLESDEEDDNPKVPPGSTKADEHDDDEYSEDDSDDYDEAEESGDPSGDEGEHSEIGDQSVDVSGEIEDPSEFGHVQATKSGTNKKTEVSNKVLDSTINISGDLEESVYHDSAEVLQGSMGTLCDLDVSGEGELHEESVVCIGSIEDAADVDESLYYEAAEESAEGAQVDLNLSNVNSNDRASDVNIESDQSSGDPYEDLDSSLHAIIDDTIEEDDCYDEDEEDTTFDDDPDDDTPRYPGTKDKRDSLSCPESEGHTRQSQGEFTNDGSNEAVVVVLEGGGDEHMKSGSVTATRESVGHPADSLSGHGHVDGAEGHIGMEGCQNEYAALAMKIGTFSGRPEFTSRRVVGGDDDSSGGEGSGREQDEEENRDSEEGSDEGMAGRRREASDEGERSSDEAESDDCFTSCYEEESHDVEMSYVPNVATGDDGMTEADGDDGMTEADGHDVTLHGGLKPWAGSSHLAMSDHDSNHSALLDDSDYSNDTDFGSRFAPSQMATTPVAIHEANEEYLPSIPSDAARNWEGFGKPTASGSGDADRPASVGEETKDRNASFFGVLSQVSRLSNASNSGSPQAALIRSQDPRWGGVHYATDDSTLAHGPLVAVRDDSVQDVLHSGKSGSPFDRVPALGMASSEFELGAGAGLLEPRPVTTSLLPPTDTPPDTLFAARDNTMTSSPVARKRAAPSGAPHRALKRLRKVRHFHPASEHQSWCPWVCDPHAATDPLRPGSESCVAGAPGWQRLLRLLLSDAPTVTTLRHALKTTPAHETLRGLRRILNDWTSPQAVLSFS